MTIFLFKVSKCDLRELCSKLIPDSIGKDIEKNCKPIYPMQDVYIRKVKVIRKPKYDLQRLVSMHTDEKGAMITSTDDGEKVWHHEGYEPPIQESV